MIRLVLRPLRFLTLISILFCCPPSVLAAADAVPETVENILTTLLQDVTQARPSAALLAPLLDYVTQPGLEPTRVRAQKRPQGEGCFARATLNVPFTTLLRYCYDPQIPGEALYPSVIRRHVWLPQSQLLRDKVKLWQEVDSLQDGAEPRVFRCAEEEEITPDTFSGCFYTYKLNRMMLLLRHKGVNMLVSVAQQQGPSSVGRVGAVVGEDAQWNYVYSQKVGSDLSLAKWAKTYLYDACTVTVLYQQGQGRTGMAFFKFLRAGWNNLNMVKTKHIAAGIQRFLQSFKGVLESPSCPTPEALVAKAQEIRAMDEAALRTALQPFAQALSTRTDTKPLSASLFKELVQDNQYPSHLNAAEMRSELIKEYIRQRMGKSLVTAGKN